MATIALLTDFGLRDTYVGTMKGVIAGIAPEAQIIDLSHGVPPQDLHAAAFALLTSYRYFPADTVFCCVVDPGVGGARRAVGVELASGSAGPYRVICPDNGLLTPVLHEAPATSAVVLSDERYHLPGPSATFHGRDIFAPAAAHLAAGTAFGALGEALEPAALVRLDWPEPERWEGGWRAQVVHIDGFGNLVTNLKGKDLAGGEWRLEVRATHLSGIKRTFGDVPRGAPLAYIGSSGYLEVAVRQGDAHHDLAIDVGERVTLTRDV